MFDSNLKPYFQHQSINDFLNWTLCLVGDDNINIAVAIMWQIWKDRNTLIFEKKYYNPTSCYTRAMMNFEKHKLSTQLDHNLVADKPQLQSCLASHWSLPPPCYIKVNIDGAFAGEQGGAGAMAKDQEGTFPGCVTSAFDCDNAIVAEAKAAMLGFQLIEDLKLHRVIVQTDSSSLSDNINNPFCLDWRIYPFVRSCKLMLANRQDILFKYVPRCCNEVAHTLAKMATILSVNKSWVGCLLPLEIIDALFAELAHVLPVQNRRIR